MVSLESLWLPILVSSAVVFVASAIVWMALPLHKNDYRKLGDKEGQVMDTVRSLGLGAGMYMFPSCDPKTVKSNPAAMDRWKAGPWGVLTVLGQAPSMGKCLGLWFLNVLIITVFVAYVAAHALPAGAEYLKVFQIVGAAALLGHGGSILTDSIWKGRPWSQAPVALIDALIYAGATAGVFGAMWPAASGPGLPGVG